MSWDKQTNLISDNFRHILIVILLFIMGINASCHKINQDIFEYGVICSWIKIQADIIDELDKFSRSLFIPLGENGSENFWLD